MIKRAYEPGLVGQLVRAKALSHNARHPAVLKAAQAARAYAEQEGAPRDWLPKAKTIADYLGLMHTGVMLSPNHPLGPILEWNLSLREWAEAIGTSSATICVLHNILGAEGLGWIERTQSLAPMRVWWADAPNAPPMRGQDDTRDPHDCIIELRGPSTTRLTKKGLAALGLAEDVLERQAVALIAKKSLPREGTERRERRADGPYAPKPPQRIERAARRVEEEDPAKVLEKFRGLLESEARGLVRPVHTGQLGVLAKDRELDAMLSRHLGNAPGELIAAADEAERFSTRMLARIRRDLARPLSKSELSTLRAFAVDIAYTELTKGNAAAPSKQRPDTS